MYRGEGDMIGAPYLDMYVASKSVQSVIVNCLLTKSVVCSHLNIMYILDY